MVVNLKIANDLVVEFHYTLTTDNGEVIDTSRDKEPLSYIHGKQMIIHGLEKELTGKGLGDKLRVKVLPDEGYGARDDQMVQIVPKEQFKDMGEITLGMRFQLRSESGETLMVSATRIDETSIHLDANHPLAGINLNFDIEIIAIRMATAEELGHGHIHDGDQCSSD